MALSVLDEAKVLAFDPPRIGPASQLEKNFIGAKGPRPGEVDVLALMRRLRRKPRGGNRLSYNGIAARLNAEGVATRTGKVDLQEIVFLIEQKRDLPEVIRQKAQATEIHKEPLFGPS